MKFKAMGFGFAMFLAGSGVMAQDIHLGVQVGGTLSSFIGEDVEAGISGDLSSRIGLTGGVVLQVGLTPVFAISPELIYTQKGQETSAGSGGTTYDLSYLQFPVLLKYFIPMGPVRPYVQAGASAGFKMVSQFVDDGGTTEMSGIEGSDIGLIVGAGLEVDKFFINGRYEMGLTDIDPDFSVQNGTVSLMAGYFFI